MIRSYTFNIFTDIPKSKVDLTWKTNLNDSESKLSDWKFHLETANVTSILKTDTKGLGIQKLNYQKNIQNIH